MAELVLSPTTRLTKPRERLRKLNVKSHAREKPLPAGWAPFGVACSAGVFFGRANVFAPESAMLRLPKRGGNGPKGYYFNSPQSSSVIKSNMAATTIRTWISFRPPKTRLHFRLPSVLTGILEEEHPRSHKTNIKTRFLPVLQSICSILYKADTNPSKKSLVPPNSVSLANPYATNELH